jgi:hypothetical protein
MQPVFDHPVILLRRVREAPDRRGGSGRDRAKQCKACKPEKFPTAARMGAASRNRRG